MKEARIPLIQILKITEANKVKEPDFWELHDAWNPGALQKQEHGRELQACLGYLVNSKQDLEEYSVRICPKHKETKPTLMDPVFLLNIFRSS